MGNDNPRLHTQFLNDLDLSVHEHDFTSLVTVFLPFASANQDIQLITAFSHIPRVCALFLSTCFLGSIHSFSSIVRPSIFDSVGFLSLFLSALAICAGKLDCLCAESGPTTETASSCQKHHESSHSHVMAIHDRSLI